MFVTVRLVIVVVPRSAVPAASVPVVIELVFIVVLVIEPPVIVGLVIAVPVN